MQPQALSMEFSRQEYWSGLPFPSPGDLPNPGTKPRSLSLQADSLLSELQGKPVFKILANYMIDTVERKMQCFKEASFSFDWHLKVKVKVAQSRLTLWDPMDYTVHEFLQARILEWVAFLFSRESFQSRDRTQVSRIAGKFLTSWATRVCVCSVQSCFSHVRLFATLWTAACQIPLSMGFSRQEYWGGLPCPPPGDPPNSGMKPVTPALQADS